MSLPDGHRMKEEWTFTRPARPFGIKVFNWLGARARNRGWRRDLSVAQILDKARRSTGLKDWGDEYFLEALEILVRALEAEADLNPFGRWFMRRHLTSAVENRLRLRDYLRRHAEALEAPLAAPLIVVGMPRTGTTLLYELLSQDPAARPLLGWESMNPVPKRSYRDRRVMEARWAELATPWIAPELRDIHPFRLDGPEECTWLMANTMVSPVYSMFANVPSYTDWLWSLEDAAWTKPYEDYVTQLLALQHQRGGGHWVLKSPIHFMSLGPLLDTVPGARVILTVRDPREVVPSACSLFAVMQGINTDRVHRLQLGRDMVEHLAQGARRCDAARARLPDRVTQVRFKDLVSDKPGTLEGVYTHFGMAFSEEARSAVDRWLEEKPHTASHRYSLEQFGVTEAMIAEHFAGLEEA